jgi:hypothetical protein
VHFPSQISIVQLWLVAWLRILPLCNLGIIGSIVVKNGAQTWMAAVAVILEGFSMFFLLESSANWFQINNVIITGSGEDEF